MKKFFAEGKWRKCYINKDGYYSFQLNGKAVLLHRYLYQAYYRCSILPGIDVHHIDEDKLNNHPHNLELKCHKKHAGEHKFKGGCVNFHKNTRKWVAYVYVSENKKLKNLGYFPTKLEAFQALYKYYPDYWNVYRQADNYVKNIYNWDAHE